MILKGSQRANGADLATHLMQALENETVEIAQTYGTVATDLHGAFAEMEATAAGTNAKNYLYSLSINPSAPLSREQYFEAIVIIEDGLGLTGQPRAVVFHVKDAREHCHVVWSKIDAVNMKAIHMAYDHSKLCDLSCILACKYGLDLPPGLKAWEEKRPFEKPYLEASTAENAIAKETGITPAQREAEITGAYDSADSPKAFQVALTHAGYILARGDKRRYVVVDRFAKVHSLTRYIKGHTAKTIKNRLQAALAFADLPTVDEAKEYIRGHQQAIEDQRAARVEQAKDKAIDVLKARQKQRRIPLEAKEQEMFIRHASERMALHAAQKTERQSFPKIVLSAAGRLLYRVKNAVSRLLRRSPALRSILGHITGDKELGLAQRHEREEQARSERHTNERAMIEREKRSMAAVEARELKALGMALRREVIESGGHAPSLFVQADHEHEFTGDIDEYLIRHRRNKLGSTFNAKADPDESAQSPCLQRNKKPRGT
jgi:hypothetical protein